jgi:hypothetical protein
MWTLCCAFNQIELSSRIGSGYAQATYLTFIVKNCLLELDQFLSRDCSATVLGGDYDANYAPLICLNAPH